MATLPLNFILLAFGDTLDYHSQANLVFLTAKKYSTPNSKFIIYTDHPEFYQWASSYVEVRTVTKAAQDEWIAEYGYFYRVKLKAMLDSSKSDFGHIVYLDTDTIVVKDLVSLNEELDRGKCLMHLRENLLCDDKGKDKMELWQKTNGRFFSDILVNEKTHMWNSGLVAIPHEIKNQLLLKALEINDEMCKLKIECRVKEQFALGITLEATGNLIEADQWLLHYWGNKEEWTCKIHNYFARLFQKNQTPLTAIHELDIHAWSCLPINRYKRPIAKRLLRWSNLWSDKFRYHVSCTGPIRNE